MRYRKVLLPLIMAHRFYKHKLLLDENFAPRLKFPRLNGLFDVKHLRDDLHKNGISDAQVYDLAVKLKRLIVTYNAKDFKALAPRSQDSGIIGISPNLSSQHIDKKLTALLVKSNEQVLQGTYTALTSETDN